MKNKEFTHRRAQVAATIGANAVLILPTATHAIRNRDVEYPFHPDSDFFYLTGFDEPEAILVLKTDDKQEDEQTATWTLFCRPLDPKLEQWTGRRLGNDAAPETLEIHEAFPIDEFNNKLKDLLTGATQLYFNLGEENALQNQILEQLGQFRLRNRAGMIYPKTIRLIDPILHEMRLIKSDAEIEKMRRAAEISAKAHCRAMQTCRPGKIEHELEGEMLHEFHCHDTRTVAYGSIVASGSNACILHYVENNVPLQDGDLVLIDAGASVDGYAADITRTFPVNGKFSDAQKELYEIVLNAQKAAIVEIRPGQTWEKIHQAAVRVITEGLVILGILKTDDENDLEKLIEKEKYKPFYMHQTGHWLGLDVHDVGDYKVDSAWRTLEPGMTLTVEPGIYISDGMVVEEKAGEEKEGEETKIHRWSVDKRWHGIGIRIEDDVLVTESGCEILTASVPKETNEIEALIQSR